MTGCSYFLCSLHEVNNVHFIIKYQKKKAMIWRHIQPSPHTHLAHFWITFKTIITHVCLEMTRLNLGKSRMYFQCGTQTFEATPTSRKKLLIPDVIYCNVAAITKIKDSASTKNWRPQTGFESSSPLKLVQVAAQWYLVGIPSYLSSTHRNAALLHPPRLSSWRRSLHRHWYQPISNLHPSDILIKNKAFIDK